MDQVHEDQIRKQVIDDILFVDADADWAAKCILEPAYAEVIKCDGDEDTTERLCRGIIFSEKYSLLCANPFPVHWHPLRRTLIQEQVGHYRMVFKVVVTPLYQVSSLSSQFDALRDTLKLIYLMALAGWVHRDISVGGELYGRCHTWVGDLEYAKRFAVDDTKTNVARTGTPAFMAIEVAQNGFLFFSDQNVRLEERPLFFHHPIHDVESGFWIGVWLLIACHIKGDDVDAEQYDLFAKYFAPLTYRFQVLVVLSLSPDLHTVVKKEPALRPAMKAVLQARETVHDLLCAMGDAVLAESDREILVAGFFDDHCWNAIMDVGRSFFAASCALQDVMVEPLPKKNPNTGTCGRTRKNSSMLALQEKNGFGQ